MEREILFAQSYTDIDWFLDRVNGRFEIIKRVFDHFERIVRLEPIDPNRNCWFALENNSEILFSEFNEILCLIIFGV